MITRAIPLIVFVALILIGVSVALYADRRAAKAKAAPASQSDKEAHEELLDIMHAAQEAEYAANVREAEAVERGRELQEESVVLLRAIAAKVGAVTTTDGTESVMYIRDKSGTGIKVDGTGITLLNAKSVTVPSNSTESQEKSE